jgi:hypothetical protein
MNRPFRISIPWFEGIYDIDQNGTVYSLWKRRKKKWEDNLGSERRKLSPWVKKTRAWPVHCVTLYHPDKRKHHFSMPKLVYGSFMSVWLKGRNDKAVVYTKDWDRLNYKLSNLSTKTYIEIFATRQNKGLSAGCKDKRI